VCDDRGDDTLLRKFEKMWSPPAPPRRSWALSCLSFVKQSSLSQQQKSLPR
jgi:hypothetical protein